MIRTILFAAILVSATAVKAQTAFTHPQQVSDTNNIQKKWFLTRYAGISTGFVAFKGGSGSFLAIPLAWQINRQLTNNLFAFGNVSVTPYLFHYTQPAIIKSNSLMQTNHFSAYPEAKIGVMYINDERTFSISGSIGVSRSSYNSYSPFYSPMMRNGQF